MADLCGAYHPVRDVCRRDGYLSQRYNDPNLQNEFNVPVLCLTRLRRSTRPDTRIQTHQYGRVAALYVADGIPSSGSLGDAAAT
jgi:hypothetical protein